MHYRGIVAPGRHRGAALGFPTANIKLSDKDLSGIYAARVRIEGADYLSAVYADQEAGLLESHLLDFSGGELYGTEIEVSIEKKIREHKDFDDDASLKLQIERDVTEVRAHFSV